MLLVQLQITRFVRLQCQGERCHRHCLLAVQPVAIRHTFGVCRNLQYIGGIFLHRSVLPAGDAVLFQFRQIVQVIAVRSRLFRLRHNGTLIAGSFQYFQRQSGGVQFHQLVLGTVQFAESRTLRQEQGRQGIFRAVQFLKKGIVYVQFCQLVAGAVHFLQLGILGKVQCSQLVVGTVYSLQIGIRRNVQRSQLIAGAVYSLQIGICRNVQRSQLIAGTVYSLQIGIRRNVQCCQLIIRAVHSLQIGIRRNFQRSQLIAGAVYSLQIGIRRNVQCCQLIAGAVHSLQIGICRNVQCCQLIIGAVYSLQIGIRRNVQRSQLVAGAVHSPQIGICRNIQCCQLIAGTVQRSQKGVGIQRQLCQSTVTTVQHHQKGKRTVFLRQFQCRQIRIRRAIQLQQLCSTGNIQCRQRVSGTIQLLQFGKDIDPRQIGNALLGYIQINDFAAFRRGQHVVTVAVQLFGNVVPELLVRKSFCRNGDLLPRRRICCKYRQRQAGHSHHARQ